MSLLIYTVDDMLTGKSEARLDTGKSMSEDVSFRVNLAIS